MQELPSFPSDRQSCLLPHPLRAQAYLDPFVDFIEKGVGAAEWSVIRRAFESDQFVLSNLPQLIDEQRLWRFKGFVETAAHAPGSTELGGAMATLVGVRHLVSPYRLFRVEDRLVELLAHTDMDADIPVSFLQLPFPRCYIELGQRRDIEAWVPNDVSGLHVLEGAYFEQGVHPARGRGLYVLLTGSPLGKRDCMDDATHAVFLSIEDPDLPLSQALENAFATALEQSQLGGYTLPTREYLTQSLHNLQWLVKALLYIGLPDARTSLHMDRTEALKQLAGLKSPGKRAKALRRLSKVSDVIYVHAPAMQGAPSGGTSEDAATRASHWRRGHYRRQAHGPAMSLRKLIFVAPMWVGEGADHAAPVKSYSVR